MKIDCPRPDDWHVHLRDDEMLQAVAPHTARTFGRALVMPNLVPPVITAADARAYRERILALDTGLTPLMTAYLTDTTDPDDLIAGFESGDLVAAKLYPAHATTNSAFGVSDIRSLDAVFSAMSDAGMVLCIHGEVTDPHVDIFDREATFIDEVLRPLLVRFPALRVILEHATTEQAVDFVGGSNMDIAATITAHHLWFNRNAIFQGGIRPHYYCLPIAKRERHRLALRRAATSGEACFFLGTDTAPHEVGRKESACGCAGLFTAPVALETYAEVFAEENALDKLPAFAAHNGARFYRMPLAEAQVTLVDTPWTPPEYLEFHGGRVRVFRGGETVGWQVA